MAHARFALVAILIAMFIIGIGGAATLCPFDITPSTIPAGSYTVTTELAGAGTGILLASDSALYQDTNNINGYASGVMENGVSTYASQITATSSTIQAARAIQHEAGQLSASEEYAQTSYNFTGLQWCDTVAGGSYGSISSGAIASQTALITPINSAYQVAFGTPEGGNDVGIGSVWLSVSAREGVNGTVIASQQQHQYVTYSGSFQFAATQSTKITHPFSSKTMKLLAEDDEEAE